MTVNITPEQIDAWANGMLEEAFAAMTEKGMDITPETLSTYFEREYQLPWTPYEAAIWLSEHGYTTL